MSWNKSKCLSSKIGLFFSPFFGKIRAFQEKVFLSPMRCEILEETYMLLEKISVLRFSPLLFCFFPSQAREKIAKQKWEKNLQTLIFPVTNILSINYFMIGTQGIFSPSQARVRIFPFRANQKMRDRKTVLLFFPRRCLTFIIQFIRTK